MKKNWWTCIGLSALMLGASGAYAQKSYAPQNGTWVVSSELDGKPGRGLALDVQFGSMVLQLYGYDSDGSPTFYMASGNFEMTVGTPFVAPLKRYTSGRYFGSDARDAQELDTAGEVRVDFDSATTATLTLPGEPPLRIQRFYFDNPLIQPGQRAVFFLGPISEPEAEPRLAMLEMDAQGVAHFQYPRYDREASAWRDNRWPCKMVPARQVMVCERLKDDGEVLDRVVVRRYLQEIVGVLETDQGSEAFKGPLLYVHGSDQSLQTQPLDTAAAAASSGPVPGVVPDSGTWVVTEEKTGRPGRGLSIDPQGSQVLVQVFNYGSDGKPTFHMGVGPYQQAAATVPLKQYRGGRSLGGPAASGVETGETQTLGLQFDSATSGWVQFPGEAAKRIERFQFGVNHWFVEADQQPLMYLQGLWTAVSTNPKLALQFDLHPMNWQPGRQPPTSYDTWPEVGSSASVKCRYEQTADGNVRCAVTGKRLGVDPELEYRFALSYRGRSLAMVYQLQRDKSLLLLGQVPLIRRSNSYTAFGVGIGLPRTY
jgi:hypothetical protein